MEKIKLAVGTISEQKLGYLREVLSEIGIEADLFPVKVESGVSEQPLSDEETRSGSLNRAKNALEITSLADYAIGIEVGYHKDDSDKYEIFCWATIIDRKNSSISKKSHGFFLPEFYQNKIRNNLYVGDHLENYFAYSPEPIVQHIARMISDRKTFITKAIEHALIYYFAREEFDA